MGHAWQGINDVSRILEDICILHENACTDACNCLIYSIR